MVAPTIFKERFPEDVEAMRSEVEKENLRANLDEHNEQMEYEPEPELTIENVTIGDQRLFTLKDFADPYCPYGYLKTF